MPQLNGGGGDDLGANDEMISFKDEGEQEEKISENVSAERDLDDVKSSLVNESESSSDSEVRRAEEAAGAWGARLAPVEPTETFSSFVLKGKKKHSVCACCVCLCVCVCQQAERRPQTRVDSESYEKARDYFSEGKPNGGGIKQWGREGGGGVHLEIILK